MNNLVVKKAAPAVLMNAKPAQVGLVQQAAKAFAKPAGKGGPGQAPTVIPFKREKTVLHQMVEDGTEFIMGAPPVLGKTYNAPRD